jgi:ABC-type glycerol-3-phosphate transport system permease component
MERTMTVKRPKYKQTAGNVAWNILQYAALIIGTFVVIIPLYFLLVASVKDTSQIVSTNPLLFPSQ